MDDESLKNLRAHSMKLYDDFQPVRDLVALMEPEDKEQFVKEFGKFMTAQFSGNFYGPSPFKGEH